MSGALRRIGLNRIGKGEAEAEAEERRRRS